MLGSFLYLCDKYSKRFNCKINVRVPKMSKISESIIGTSDILMELPLTVWMSDFNTRHKTSVLQLEYHMALGDQERLACLSGNACHCN